MIISEKIKNNLNRKKTILPTEWTFPSKANFNLIWPLNRWCQITTHPTHLSIYCGRGWGGAGWKINQSLKITLTVIQTHNLLHTYDFLHKICECSPTSVWHMSVLPLSYICLTHECSTTELHPSNTWVFYHWATSLWHMSVLPLSYIPLTHECSTTELHSSWRMSVLPLSYIRLTDECSTTELHPSDTWVFYHWALTHAGGMKTYDVWRRWMALCIKYLHLVYL